MSLIFVIFQTILSLVGCILNGLLCHVAYHKSPKVIKTYSIVTVNFAFTDFIICLINFILQIRMIPIGKTLVFVSYGPCKWLGSKICFDLYSILLHLYTHTIWLLLVSFCYRYYVIIHSEPSKIHVKLLLIVIYIPSFIQMILLFFDYANPLVLMEIQHHFLPEYNLNGLLIFGFENSLSFRAMFAIVHVALISTPIVLGIFRLRRKILEKLDFKGIEVRSTTQTLQIQLLRVLTFQAVIPLFYLIGVASYFLLRFELYRHSFLEFLIFSSFLLVPVLTPISTFIIVKPYRLWLFRMFRYSKVMTEDYGTRESRLYTVNTHK